MSAFVQGTNVGSGGGTSTPNTPLSGVVGGNALIAIVSWNTATGSITSVKDDLNNSFTAYGAVITNASGNRMQGWYLFNATAGNRTVTATLSGALAGSSVWLIEANSLTGTLDGQNENQGSSASASTGTVVTTNASDFLVAAARGGGYTAGGAGWTDIAGLHNLQYRDVVATGTYSDAMTLSATTPWVAYIMAFASSAATPPSVSVQVPSSVTQTSATLNGSIDALGTPGNPTARGFQWGLTTGYGSSETESGSFSTGAFTYNLTGLSSGTVYHYRSFATNTAGTVFSGDQVFSTVAAPGQIVPSVILPDGMVLSWNQDFRSSDYASPFNVAPNIVPSPQPPGALWTGQAIWAGYDGVASGNINVKSNGTEGDPYSTSAGYLNIHGNGTPSGGVSAYGGEIRSAAGDGTQAGTFGFLASNSYWEAAICNPHFVTGSVWPAWWVVGPFVGANGFRGEVDICEFGWQQSQSTTGGWQTFVHRWPDGSTPGSASFGSQTITADDFHVWGCLIQAGTAKIYLDGVLVKTYSSLDPAFSYPMGAVLDLGFGPGFPLTGNTTDLKCKYIRCWSAPGDAQNVVPNVVGSTQSAATALLQNRYGFGTVNVTTQINGNIPVGQVVSMSPAPGAMTPTNTSINLTVSLGSGSVGLLAADPDTLERPPFPVVPQVGREAFDDSSVHAAHRPLPGETQDQYNTRLGTSYPGGSKKALNPYTGLRPPESIPPVPDHESDDAYNARTGRKPLPGETQIAYNTRVPSIPPRN